MARRVKVRLTDGMQDLLNDPGVRRDLTSRAERVLQQAQGTAPVRSGRYRDSLRIIQGTTDRVAVGVGSDVEYAFAVESGAGVLSRALDAAG